MQNMTDHSLATHSAFDDHYGLLIARCDEDGIDGSLEVRAHHLQPTRVVHGGVYASIAEALASFATNWHVLRDGKVALGMHNATSFLRPCAGGTLHGRAEPLHRGRTTWVWDVRITDDEGRLCASGRVTLAVRPIPDDIPVPAPEAP
ncbi:MAG: thioesterase superfamily protein [Solirubrobacterales bacterium]|nr:thioesterase superfamily protein [Solirubrobacterales bacterium]